MNLLPKSINYHLIHACNFNCKHCFAKNYDYPIGSSPMLSLEHMNEIIEKIAKSPAPEEYYQRKLTFTGGEPVLCSYLPNIIDYARKCGLVTMLVTNGSLLNKEYLEKLKSLNWLALSIDSFDICTLKKIGRNDKQGKTYLEKYIQIANIAHDLGIRLKINTVVNAYNYHEDMTSLITKINPERWKILQAICVTGQNDDYVADFSIDSEKFNSFISRQKENLSKCHNNIIIVPESEEDIRGTYAMIDPCGRFFDNVEGKYCFSQPILDVGCEIAFNQITFNYKKFEKRGGDYQF